MAKPKPRKKRREKNTPPVTEPPPAPRVIGLDCVELRVPSPAATAQTYRAIGFEPRTTVGNSPRVAVGGLELVLKRGAPKSDHQQPIAGIAVRLAVDDVDKMRDNLVQQGLRPGRLKVLPRGDRCFDWRDPAGCVYRFVGPARRPDDKRIDET